MKTACEHTKNDLPLHAPPITLNICADSRKNDCPYYVRVEIDNDHVAFHQGFCGYGFKKVLVHAPPEKEYLKKYKKKAFEIACENCSVPFDKYGERELPGFKLSSKGIDMRWDANHPNDIIEYTVSFEELE